MLYTPEELKKLTELTPEVLQWLEAHPLPPLPDVSRALQFRAVMSLVDQQITKAFPDTEDGVLEDEKQVVMRDGFKSRLRITKPEHKPAAGSPLVVWLYGGGYVGGSPTQVIPRARHLAKLFGAVCCAPSYRLGPENRFPIAPNDVWDHMKWITENAESIGADPKLGFIVGGVSAGGALATVVVRRAHIEEPLAYPITGQWLECPYVFTLPEKVPEKYRHVFLCREHGRHTPLLTTADLDSTPDTIDWEPHSTLLSPVNYTRDYKGMPKTYFSIDGADPMRDDGLIYDEMLKADGVDTKTDVYPGCPHAHILFMPDSDIGRQGFINGLQGAAWLLGKQVTTDEIVSATPKMRVSISDAVDAVTEKVATIAVSNGNGE